MLSAMFERNVRRDRERWPLPRPRRRLPQGTGTKWVWLFREGNASLRDLLGGKGAGLAEMTNAGLPVPPGLTITTEACNAYYASGRTFPAGMWDQAWRPSRTWRGATGKRFGDPANSLLVSVRSGAKFSMPGMMDTILNLGLNDVTVEGLAGATNNPRFAYDSYRRFIQMYGNVVLDIDKDAFEHAPLGPEVESRGADRPRALRRTDLKAVIGAYKEIVQREKGSPSPATPWSSCGGPWRPSSPPGTTTAPWSTGAEKIPDDLGTAVNVQTMVFGNMGPDSGTGVAFTRNPSTGERSCSGTTCATPRARTWWPGSAPLPHLGDAGRPQPRRRLRRVRALRPAPRGPLQGHAGPRVHHRAGQAVHAPDALGKRTARRAVRIAVDLANEGVIDRRTAVQRVPPGDWYSSCTP